jgi:hypothetical protein
MKFTISVKIDVMNNIKSTRQPLPSKKLEESWMVS